MIVLGEKAFEVVLLRASLILFTWYTEAEEQLLLCIMSGNEATLKVIVTELAGPLSVRVLCMTWAMLVAVTEIWSHWGDWIVMIVQLVNALP